MYNFKYLKKSTVQYNYQTIKLKGHIKLRRENIEFMRSKLKKIPLTGLLKLAPKSLIWLVEIAVTSQFRVCL